MLARCLVLLTLVALSGCPNQPVIHPKPTPPSPTSKGPTDPADVVDGDISVVYENGLRILVKRNPGAELASVQLFILGGAQLRTKANAGAEVLALDTAVNGGTTSLDKDAFSKKLTALGSEMGAGSQHAYSVMGASSLTDTFDETFALLAEAFLSPAMPENEIELRRQRQLVSIKRRTETPDGRLGMKVIEAMYTGHPYENMSDGTVESVSAQTPAMLKAHLATLRFTRRLVLVVVGDIPADHVRELVRGNLAKLPRGDFDPTPIRSPKFKKPKAVITAEELPTNYIEASFVGPGWSDPDFAAAILGMRVLKNRVWEEVRTKRNLSYAPSAQFRWSSEVTRGSLYVTAVDANQALEVMINEARRLQNEPIPPKVLNGAKSVFLTSHLMSNEATDDQATWLALCDLVGGDWRLSRTLPKRIHEVTAADIQAFAKKHIHDLQTVVLGDPSKIDKGIFESL